MRTVIFRAGGILAAILVIGMLAAPMLRAQTNANSQTKPASSPSFEVVSIKPDHSEARPVQMVNRDPGRLVGSATVKTLICFAFHVRDFQVSGGPSWIDTERFAIDAKVEDSMAEQLRKLPLEQQAEQMSLMVRSMLVGRFGLEARSETKDLPVFALTIAKGGPKLAESAAAPTGAPVNPAPVPVTPGRGGGSLIQMPGSVMIRMGSGGQMMMTGKSASLGKLVDMLNRQVDRPIVDQTGLAGTYEFAMQWTYDPTITGAQLPSGGEPPDAIPAAPSGTSIFSAIQEQLGLKLESTKAPYQVIVINRVERPTPN